MTTAAQAITRLEDLAALLWANNADGLTKHEIAAALGVDYRIVGRLVHDLREWCGQTEKYTVTCESDPTDPTGPWRYRVVGDLTEAEPWLDNRERDMDTRLATLTSVANSLVAVHPGNTTKGRKARIVARHLVRMSEDLEDLRTNVPVGP